MKLVRFLLYLAMHTIIALVLVVGSLVVMPVIWVLGIYEAFEKQEKQRADSRL